MLSLIIPTKELDDYLFETVCKYSLSFNNDYEIIIVFDVKGCSSRRRKLYPEYKNKRRRKIRLNRINEYENIEDERHSMLMQLSRCVEYLEALPLTIISVDNVEADDVIAYISKQLLPKSNHIIMSTDKDFLQLVDEKTTVWNPTKKILYEICRELNVANLTKNSINNTMIKFPLELNNDIYNSILEYHTKYTFDKIHTSNRVGIVNGLWANTLGLGGILPIESVLIPTL